MNQDKETLEYLAGLPQKIQDVIFDDAWLNRTTEVAKKYSLTEEQTEGLINLTLLVISGIDKAENFLETIISDLSISRLLAEQIVEDLETRVFEYVLKLIEEKPKTQNTVAQNTSRIPEIKPDNLPAQAGLPAIEVGEVAKPYTPQIPVPRPSEPVQKPYSVPRFGMSEVQPKVAVINLAQNKPQSPESMMENKMGNVTVNMGSDFMQKEAPATNEPPKMPTTKYSSDPYREPLG